MKIVNVNDKEGNTSQELNTDSSSTQQQVLQESNEQLMQNALIKEERIQIKPKIITQRITAKPKIITERIVGKPRVITEQVIEPTRQRIVIKPTINRTVEQIKPQYNQQDDEVIVRDPVTKEIQYKQEQRRQVIDIQGDIVNNNYIVQPQVKKVKAEIQFQSEEPIRRTLEPMVREPMIENNVIPRQYNIDGDVYITQPYVQPIQQQENIKIDWRQEDDKVVERNPITREPIYQTRQRTQNVSVPGNIYYSQKIVRPQINREELEVRFKQQPTIERELKPIIKDTQYSKSKSIQRNIIPYTIRDEIPIGVPQPVVYDVPVYQYKYEPVEEPCEPCCCDDNNKGKLGNVDSIINSAEIEIVRGNEQEGSIMEVGEQNYTKKLDRNKDKVYFGDAVKHFSKQYGSDTLKRKDKKKRNYKNQNRNQHGVSSQNNLHLSGDHQWNQVPAEMSYHDLMGY